VLKSADKEHLEDLEDRVEVVKRTKLQPFPNSFLATIQQAIVKKYRLLIEYYSDYNQASTQREVEPIGISYYGEGWHLIAFCRLRHDYRDFRADRIKSLTNTGQFFRNQHLSLQHYLQQFTHPEHLQEAVVLFDQSAVRYLGEQKYVYGFQSEEKLGDKLKIHFRTAYMESLGRWLLSYGNAVHVEKPERLKDIMLELASEIQSHYLSREVHR
jgi:predicted DNA-binding transcriptional regulator YafY